MDIKTNRKQHILAIATFSIVVSLVFAPAVHAGIGGRIEDSFRSVVDAMLSALLSGLQAMAGGLLHFSSDILAYVMSDSFNATIIGHPFVVTGWEITRDIANMFFILVLIAIAAATILRQEGYSAKRLLPSVIIIALLINFSNVLVGLVIDVSQIFMRFFLEPFENASLATRLINSANFEQLFKSEIAGESNAWQELFMKIFVMFMDFLIMLYAAAILFGIAILYIIRTVILWMVAILAPIAFISWILPATRGKIWSSWWDTLIKWSLFGPIATFFLFLASTIMEGMASFGADAPTRAGYSGSIQGFWGDASYFLQAAAVFILLTLSMTVAGSYTGGVAAKVTGAITGYAAGVGRGMTYKPARWAGRKGVKAGAAVGRAAREKAGKEFLARTQRPTGWGQKTAMDIAQGKHALSRIPGAQLVARNVTEPLLAYQQRARQKVEEAAEHAKSWTTEDTVNQAKITRDTFNKLGYQLAAKRKNALSQKHGFTEEELGETQKLAENLGLKDVEKELKIANLHVAMRRFGWTHNNTLAQGLASKASPQDIASMSAEAVKDEQVQELLKLLFKQERGGLSPQHLSGIVRSGNNELIKNIGEYVIKPIQDAGQNFSEGVERYLKRPEARVAFGTKDEESSKTVRRNL